MSDNLSTKQKKGLYIIGIAILTLLLLLVLILFIKPKDTITSDSNGGDEKDGNTVPVISDVTEAEDTNTSVENESSNNGSSSGNKGVSNSNSVTSSSNNSSPSTNNESSNSNSGGSSSNNSSSSNNNGGSSSNNGNSSNNNSSSNNNKNEGSNSNNGTASSNNSIPSINNGDSNSNSGSSSSNNPSNNSGNSNSNQSNTPQQPSTSEQPTTTPVTGVTIKGANEVYIGDNITLTATVTPSNATNKNVTWASSNTSVATVSNGVVTGKSTGKVTITVTADGNHQATIEITVKEKPVTYTVTLTPLKQATGNIVQYKLVAVTKNGSDTDFSYVKIGTSRYYSLGENILAEILNNGSMNELTLVLSDGTPVTANISYNPAQPV